jgi:hypothetical protein
LPLHGPLIRNHLVGHHVRIKRYRLIPGRAHFDVMPAGRQRTSRAAVYQRMYRYRRGLYSAEHFQRLASRRAARMAPLSIKYEPA